MTHTDIEIAQEEKIKALERKLICTLAALDVLPITMRVMVMTRAAQLLDEANAR